MAFTEFVVPTLNTDPQTAAIFGAEIGPHLVRILDTHATPPKDKYFGKILIENGNDVSGIFRLCVGLEWEDSSHFNSFIASHDFEHFKSLVKPHSAAQPIPQLYKTDLGPSKVFGSALTEVWQVKIGETESRVAQSSEAWEKFVAAVEKAHPVEGAVNNFHGTSLNLEEQRWTGALGWESMEVREKILGTTEVKQAKKSLEHLAWNTFVTAFAK